MEHINDPCVVELTVRLEQGNKDRIFAILVELLQEVLVLTLRRGAIIFVLHLEHNRDNLRPSLIRVTKDVVALTSCSCIVVLLEVCPWKCRRSNSVELGFAVLLKGLANHLGR